MAEEKVNKISRREFLKDAGLVVGSAAIGSTALLSACNGGDATKPLPTLQQLPKRFPQLCQEGHKR
jgi:hypothetical protein